MADISQLDAMSMGGGGYSNRELGVLQALGYVSGDSGFLDYGDQESPGKLTSFRAEDGGETRQFGNLLQQGLYATDPSGNLRHGTAGYLSRPGYDPNALMQNGVTPRDFGDFSQTTQGNVSFGGKEYFRDPTAGGGLSFEEAYRGDYAPMMDKRGVGAGDFTYDPTLGYMMESNPRTNAYLQDRTAFLGKAHDPVSGFADAGGLVALLAAGGAGLAAAGAGAAGGVAAAEGAGGAAGAAGATGSWGAAGGALEGVGATAGGAAGGAGGAVAAASPYASWGAFDPIQAIQALDAAGGGMGATAGAQSLGYASVSDAIANAAAWAGPGAFSTAGGAGGATPDASFRGLADKLGQGVTPSDLLRSVTGDLGTALAKFGVPGFGGSTGGVLGLGGGMSPWSIGQGLYGLYSANKMKKQAAELGRRADPWAQYRGDAASRLDALSRDPSSITKDPGYGAGLEAVQRSMAAQGYQGSGNMMAALQKYGSDFYEKAIARLSGLAGANQNPAAGPTLEMQGSVNAANLTGQSLNRFAYGMTR